LPHDEGLQAFGQREEGRYILKLIGHIDMATVDRFENALAQAVAAPEPTVLVDLSGVDYIDSTGISALMRAETSARLDVERIQFLGKLQPDVEALLRMSGVYDELRFFEPKENGNGVT
jgi:anti-sigma B factor antagonist